MAGLFSRDEVQIRDANFEEAIHRRLLQGERAASEELVAEFQAQLVKAIEPQFATFVAKFEDSDAIGDSVVDALMSYIKRPEQYQPAKRSLFEYLKMSARGDLLNRLKRICKQKGEEIGFVELTDSQRNKYTAGDDGQQSVDDNDRMQKLLDALDSEEDREIVRLMQQGEFKTAVFAEVLGIADLPVDEQRTVVKRHKDRLKRKMQRLQDVDHGQA